MTSHNDIPLATPTCDSYGRTDGRTNEESWSPSRDTPSSVTHARTYGDLTFAHVLVIAEAARAVRAAIKPTRPARPNAKETP